MRKLLAVLAGLAALFLLAAAAGVLYLKAKYPPERIRDLVVAEAEKALSREVEVRAVDFGLLSGLKVEGVRVSERPDFKKGEFLGADAFVLRFSWLPLLRRKLVAHEVLLVRPRAVLIKNKDGSLNVSDLLPAATAQGKAPAPVPAAPRPAAGAGTALALQVDAVRVTDASFRYVDRQAGSESVLALPSAAVRDFRLDGRFGFEVETALEYKAGKDSKRAEVKAKGWADLAGGDAARFAAEVSELALSAEGVTLTGRVALQDSANPRLEGEVRADGLSALAPPGYQVPKAALAFKARLSGKAAAVPSFEASLGDLKVSGKLEVADLSAAAPRIAVEAASNEFDLAPLAEVHPRTRGKGLSGKASFKLSAKGPLDALEVPSASFRARAGAVKAGTFPELPADLALPAGSLEVLAAKKGGTLELERVALAAGPLKAALKGTVSELEAKEPLLRLSLVTETIPFEAFAPYVKGISALSGNAKLDARIEGRPSAPKASGTFDLKGAGAAFLGQRLEAFTGAVKFTQASLEMPRLTGRVNGGDLVLSVAVDAADPKEPTATVNGTLSVLDAGALEALLAQAPGGPAGGAAAQPQAQAPAPYDGPVLRTSGRFEAGKITHPNFSSGRASLEWALVGVTPELKRLDGTARLRVGSGKAVKLLELARQKGGLSRAMVAPLEILDKASKLKLPGVSIPPLNEIPFDRIEGDYAFKQGVMTMRPSLFDGPTLWAETNGTVDLPASTLDLKTEIRASGLGKIQLTATGKLDDPTVRPALSESTKERIQEKGKDILKKEGQKILKQLFK